MGIVEGFVEVLLIRLGGFYGCEVRPPQWAGCWGLGAALNPFPLFFVLVAVGEAKLFPPSYLCL